MGVGSDRAVARRGQAVTLAEPSLPAGYSPDKLDKTIQKFIAVAEQNIRHAESLESRVKAALENLPTVPEDDALQHANKITMLWERLAKTGMALVKATDELSRLRSFMAGGPDSRPDLTIKGELQLQGIVLQAVKMLGKEKVLEVFANE